MKAVIQHPVYGEIAYAQGALNGRSLTIGGVPLRRVSSTDYEYSPPGAPPEPVRLYGNFLTGVSLSLRGEEIPVIPRLCWPQAVFSALIFAAVLLWNMIPALMRLLPTVGGALGGLVGGIAAVVNVNLIRRRPLWLGALISLGMAALAILVCAALARLLLSVFG